MAHANSTLGGTSIDKGSPVPIYAQLKDIIRASIEEKRLAPDQRIPSENELSASYGISRMTVRQAIRELVRDGYVYVRKGEGTFVSRIGATQMLVKLDGFSTEMAKLGYRVRSEVLGVSRIGWDEGYAEAFAGLSEKEGGALVAIERIRYVENEPFAAERSYLALRTGERLLERSFDETFSIYRYLAAEEGISLARAEHAIEARLADRATASSLRIRAGSPVLFIRGTTYAGNGQPVEYLEGSYRGDRYTFRVNIVK
jgi:GntR family transcriptional regulator